MRNCDGCHNLNQIPNKYIWYNYIFKSREFGQQTWMAKQRKSYNEFIELFLKKLQEYTLHSYIKQKDDMRNKE